MILSTIFSIWFRITWPTQLYPINSSSQCTRARHSSAPACILLFPHFLFFNVTHCRARSRVRGCSSIMRSVVGGGAQCFEIGGHGYNFMCGIISFVIWLLLAVFESNIIIMSIEEASRIGWNKIYLGYASTQCFEIGGHGYNFLCGNIRFVIWLLLAVFESNIIIMSIEEARIGWKKIYLGYASGHQRAKIHQYQDANIFKLAQNYHNFAIAQKFLYEMDLTTDV